MMTVAKADLDSDGLEESELTSLTKAQLRQVAADGGYDLAGATTKAAMITAILTASAVDITGTLTETQLGYFTVDKILAIATAREYTMTKTAADGKAAVITEFLSIQNA